MRNINIFALFLSLLFTVAIHASFAQPRPRRLVDPAPTPSPVPSASMETRKQQAKSSDAESSTTPSDADRLEQDDVVRVDTNLVTVPVSVLDRDGRYLPDLQKEDFVIYEDGIQQEIGYF